MYFPIPKAYRRPATVSPRRGSWHQSTIRDHAISSKPRTHRRRRAMPTPPGDRVGARVPSPNGRRVGIRIVTFEARSRVLFSELLSAQRLELCAAGFAEIAKKVDRPAI